MFFWFRLFLKCSRSSKVSEWSISYGIIFGETKLFRDFPTFDEALDFDNNKALLRFKEFC